MYWCPVTRTHTHIILQFFRLNGLPYVISCKSWGGLGEKNPIRKIYAVLDPASIIPDPDTEYIEGFKASLLYSFWYQCQPEQCDSYNVMQNSEPLNSGPQD